MYSLEEISAILREKQAKMQERYETRTTVGTPMELPWEGHLPVKVIVNRPSELPEGKMPYFINSHGGAFIEGDAVTMDSYCQMLADRLGIVVFNLNYRLAPDFVYDYQIREVDVVRDYVEVHQEELQVDASRCGIGGFSAGASLSLASIVHRLQTGKSPYSCCVLGYPLTTNAPGSIDPDAPYQPGDAQMMAAIGLYLDGHEMELTCSPLLAEDEFLKQFPATILITCEKDALSEQGRAFAARLVQCGVRVHFQEYRNAFHGFIEVNRPDYFPEDPRKTPEQQALSNQAEDFITQGLCAML